MNMLDRIKKSKSNKNLGSYSKSHLNNCNDNYIGKNSSIIKDTDSLTSKCIFTPSMVLYNGDIYCNNKYSNEKVIVKITNSYLEIYEKCNLVIIKTILLKDVKEFNHSGSFWEITFRNEQGEFITFSFQTQKAHSLNSKVLEFLRQIKREEDHNSEFLY